MTESSKARIEFEKQRPVIAIGATAETEADSISFVLDSIREKGKPPVSFTLPPNLPKEIIETSNTQEDTYKPMLLSWLASNFNLASYQPAIDLINSRWQPVQTQYLDILEQINGLNIPQSIHGNVVLYGVGGGYYPDKSTFSIWTDGNPSLPKFKRTNPIHTVGHEIIELSMNPHVKSLEIPYWQKERVVDLLMSESPLASLFPGYKQQDNGDRTVDKHFSWESAKSNIAEMLAQIKGSHIVH